MIDDCFVTVTPANLTHAATPASSDADKPDHVRESILVFQRNTNRVVESAVLTFDVEDAVVVTVFTEFLVEKGNQAVPASPYICRWPVPAVHSREDVEEVLTEFICICGDELMQVSSGADVEYFAVRDCAVESNRSIGGIRRCGC